MATVNLPPDFKEFLKLLNAHLVEVSVIDLAHLKTNKKAAARHKDLDDLENLP